MLELAIGLCSWRDASYRKRQGGAILALAAIVKHTSKIA
jgi:hypothetical protein